MCNDCCMGKESEADPEEGTGSHGVDHGMAWVAVENGVEVEGEEVLGQRCLPGARYDHLLHDCQAVCGN